MNRDYQLTERQTNVVFGGLLLAMILAVLDQTILVTALPTIVGELGGVQHLSWVITAYMLAATASTPIWGKISDLYGRKPLFCAAIVVFLAGSVLSGVAQSMGQLIAFRALQGLGAGGLMTLAMTIVADIVEPRERGRYMGYTQVVFLAASVVGPLVGGLLVDHLSWRWVFYVNVPIGAAALAVIGSVLHLPTERVRHSIDYLGAALLVAAVSSLLLVTVWGGQEYAWDSAQILGLTAAGLILLGAFVAQERRAAEPILPLRLFRGQAFAIVTAVMFIATCSLMAAIVFLPLFLQIVIGENATDSGLLLMPLMAASTISTVASGRGIRRTGRYKAFPVAGLALMTAGLVLLSTMDPGTSLVTASAFMAVFGLGFGMVSQVLLIALQASVDRRELGIATGAANFFRALGGSIGVAVFGAIFTAGLDGTVDGGRLQSSPEAVQGLAPAARASVVEAVADSVTTVFLVAAPIAAIGFLLVLFLEERPLRGPAPAQAAPKAAAHPEPKHA
jgi:EmrB/QacA subfamily drug resistance transporter